MQKHAERSFKRNLKSKKKRKLRRKGIITPKDVARQDRMDRYDLKRRYRSYKWVIAPSCFSLIKDPENTIAFINKINILFSESKKVFIDLESVKEIGHGAIVVLLALMVQFRSNNIQFNGNFSKVNKVNKMLRESGFFDKLKSTTSIAQQDVYEISQTDNSIYTHAQKKVNPELSDAIIKKASKSIWGEERRCTGVQRIFLELMQNTNNHASKLNGEKHWWISTNYNKTENKVCFSFIDFGIGIFESLAKKNTNSPFYNIVNKIKQAFNSKNNCEMLQLLLNGEVHKTATGKYYRGKGLPGVFNETKNNSISNLIIISNDAFANIEQLEYKSLHNNLTGTFIYWELNDNNKNIK